MSEPVSATRGEDTLNVVLVIEDDATTRALITLFLQREGFSVVSAS